MNLNLVGREAKSDSEAGILLSSINLNCKAVHIGLGWQ
jgi:hypothetical protein